MFSFFKSSKKSPVISPTDNKIEENTQKNGEDFVLVNPSQPSSNIYPPTLHPQFSPYSTPSNLPTSPHSRPLNRQFSVSVNYTASVPFKINPTMTQNDNDVEVWNFKLREMNSLLHRVNNNDYDFKLERSVLES